MFFFPVFCRHTYPSPCPPHSPLSPLRAVNKLWLSRPSRGPPTLHHLCTPLPTPLPTQLLLLQGASEMLRWSTGPSWTASSIQPEAGKTNYYKCDKALGPCCLCPARSTCPPGQPPAKPGRKLGLPLYSPSPWDALPSQWRRWVREVRLALDLQDHCVKCCAYTVVLTHKHIHLTSYLCRVRACLPTH